MNHARNAAFAAALVASLPLGASAAAGGDIAELRRQLDTLRSEYDQRIQALEQRVREAEATAAAAQQRAGQAAAEAQAAPAQPARASAANAFNPAISLVLDGKFRSFSRDPEDYAIPGFLLGGEAGIGEEGLSLGESELTMSANVDDKFYGFFTAAVHDHEGSTEIELEEAYIQTLALPAGLTAKAGRFFSGIGYLNEQHAHTWDFADEPLAYRALLARQYADDGVQLRWLAPTDLFVEAGAELTRGERFPGAGGDGTGAHSLFVHVGGDVGASHSWRAGVSRLWTQAEGRGADADHELEHGHGGPEPSMFDGDSTVTIADVVWKWAPDGNATHRNLVLQAEYLHREEDGTIAVDEGAEVSTYDGSQDGWYVQGVYQFMPRWRFGLRYDRLTSDNRGDELDVLDEAGLLAGGHDPSRWSAMLDFSNSEFSRLRLQYNRDESRPEADDQWILQYVTSIGAHGAHRY